MSNSPSSNAAASSVKKVASALILLGNLGFWLQLLLGIISLMMLLFSTPLLGISSESSGNENLAIFCATVGVLTLALSIFFFFRRYISIGQSLKNARSGGDRPNKKYTIRLIRLGLTSNLAGMFISIIGVILSFAHKNLEDLLLYCM